MFFKVGACGTVLAILGVMSGCSSDATGNNSTTAPPERTGATSSALQTPAGDVVSFKAAPAESWVCGAGNGQFGTGDFNGDGYTDLYCNANSGVISIALNKADGSGTFTELTWENYGCPVTGYQFGTGDFNGDGKTDFYCNAPNGNIWTVVSNISGLPTSLSVSAFTSAWWANWGCGTSAYQFGTGDFNHDRKTDFYCSGNASAPQEGIWTVLSQGNGNFASQSYMTWNCPAGEYDLGTGDFNGDGYADFYCNANSTVPAAYAGDVWIAINTKNNSFTTPAPTLNFSCPTDNTGAQIGTGDFNGDGKTDLYCNHSTNEGMYAAISNGDGTFTFNDQYDAAGCIVLPGEQIGTGDFNDDGLTDVYCVAPTASSAGGSIEGLVLFESTGSGFSAYPWATVTCPLTTYPAGNTKTGNVLQTGYFNGLVDGHTGFICDGSNGQIESFLENSVPASAVQLTSANGIPAPGPYAAESIPVYFTDGSIPTTTPVTFTAPISILSLVSLVQTWIPGEWTVTQMEELETYPNVISQANYPTTVRVASASALETYGGIPIGQINGNIPATRNFVGITVPSAVLNKVYSLATQIVDAQTNVVFMTMNSTSFKAASQITIWLDPRGGNQ